MARPSLTLVAAGVAVAAIPGAALNGAASGAQVPVGPNQSFVGLVNGKLAGAQIEVLCRGPAQTGHPVAGQTLSVQSRSRASDSSGFTGRRAHAIVTEFVPTSTVGAPIKEMFTDYGDLPIPTTVRLPCSGTSTVRFGPRPTSRTARSTRVSVTFEATTGDRDTEGPVDIPRRPA